MNRRQLIDTIRIVVYLTISAVLLIVFREELANLGKVIREAMPLLKECWAMLKEALETLRAAA